MPAEWNDNHHQEFASFWACGALLGLMYYLAIEKASAQEIMGETNKNAGQGILLLAYFAASRSESRVAMADRISLVRVVPDVCTPLFSVLGAPPKPLGMITGRVGNGGLGSWPPATAD
jgi:hypothetical protein